MGLLRAAQAGLPAHATLEIASLKDIPLYDGDLEAAGVPPAVAAFKAQARPSFRAGEQTPPKRWGGHLRGE